MRTLILNLNLTEKGSQQARYVTGTIFSVLWAFIFHSQIHFLTDFEVFWFSLCFFKGNHLVIQEILSCNLMLHTVD